MTDNGDDMITTTSGGEAILSVRLDWLKITEVAVAVAFGIIAAALWLHLTGVKRHGS